MNPKEKGKTETVLVTGGTDGLGRAAALRFAEVGYRVFAAGRNAEKRAALAQLAEEKNLTLQTLDLDVTSDESVDRAMAEIERRAGPVDVLLNIAGIAIVGAMEEVTIADLRKQFETNVFAVVRLAQRVLPGMRERGRGCLVNMSSVAGRVSNPLMGPYSGSKHALETISDALRLELVPFGVRVILIEPGFIRTNINRAGAELSARYTANAASSPYARLYIAFLKMWQKMVARSTTTPEDCAEVILRAVRSPRPRPRYVVTREAKITLALHWLLSDRRLDRMTLQMLSLKRTDGPLPSAEAMRAQLEETVRASSGSPAKG